MHYLFLLIAILFEVVATMNLKPNDALNPAVQIGIVIVGYSISFLFLSFILKTMSIGIVYATWSAVGMVLVAVLGIVFFKQKLDLAAWIGIVLIISGVLIMNLISKSVIH